MSLTKEIIEAQKLDETQVKAIDAAISDEVATEKQGFDTKANDDAEAIIDGALSKTVTLTGIQREQGEKNAVYLERVASLYVIGQVASEKKKFDDATITLQKKIDDSKPDELVVGQLADANAKIDAFLIKEVEFDRVIEGDFEKKYTDSTQKNETLTRGMAFSKVRPSFPDTANMFEVSARWAEFETNTLKDWDVVFDKDNTDPLCVSKENKHKQIKLSELVDKDEKITALKTGRKLKGFEKETDITLISIDDVPFKVPENATPQQRAATIRQFLLKDRIPVLSQMSTEYAKLYEQYNKLLLGQKTVKT